jgi:hypothetical protein
MIVFAVATILFLITTLVYWKKANSYSAVGDSSMTAPTGGKIEIM